MKTPPMVKRKIKIKTALTLSWRGKFLLSCPCALIKEKYKHFFHLIISDPAE